MGIIMEDFALVIGKGFVYKKSLGHFRNSFIVSKCCWGDTPCCCEQKILCNCMDII
jgi:hypothetical protein